MEKYPSWPKGLPWKGSRSLVAARGVKSLLLRYFLNEKVHIENSGRKIKKFLTEGSGCDNLLKLTCEGEQLPEQTAKRKIKKFLTSEKQRDKILKLLLNKNSEEP